MSISCTSTFIKVGGNEKTTGVQWCVCRLGRGSLDKRTGALVSKQADSVASLCRCLTKLIRRVKGKCLSDHRSRCEKYLPLL